MLKALRPALRPLLAWVDNRVPEGRRRRRKELAIYSQFITPGDLCLDIGAHIGNTTETFLKLGARVVCVEPQESCIKMLERRFGHRRDVTLLRSAVTDRPGDVELWMCTENDAIATTSESWIRAVTDSGRMTRFVWDAHRRVPATTLDALLEQYGPVVVCKVDVEGAELQVLRGLSRPIPFVAFEYHLEWIDQAVGCVRHLESPGDAEFNYSTHESTGLALDAWVSADDLLSRIAAEKNPFLWGDIFARCTSRHECAA